MIDLIELEKRLDEALAKETKDSLNSWLDSQRFNDINFVNGESNIQLLPCKPISFSLNLPIKSNYNKPSDNFAGESNYDIAA